MKRKGIKKRIVLFDKKKIIRTWTFIGSWILKVQGNPAENLNSQWRDTLHALIYYFDLMHL